MCWKCVPGSVVSDLGTVAQIGGKSGAINQCKCKCANIYGPVVGMDNACKDCSHLLMNIDDPIEDKKGES